MLQAIIKKTLRVPIQAAESGDGEHVARQLDVALMAVGFKLSRELLEHYSAQHPALVIEQGKAILVAVKELVGDHVQHHVYFIDFPHGVPDTQEFWWAQIVRLFFTGQHTYGRYQHSYEEMLAVHDDFLSSAKDRITVLHLGKSLEEETLTLYHQLISSKVPLNEADRVLVRQLTEHCLDTPLDAVFLVRETRAIINAVRLEHGKEIATDTVTDILRLACTLSNGDVTLQEPTKFCSFSHGVRRRLLDALDDVLLTSPTQLADIKRYQEQWKRLGERLHPHEYADKYPYAVSVFAVARGEQEALTLEAKIEEAFKVGDLSHAIALLQLKPGLLVRNVDRLIRSGHEHAPQRLLDALPAVLPHVSGRVLLGLREHLQNRLIQRPSRIFTNSKGRAWVTEDTVPPLQQEYVTLLCHALDKEITSRLPRVKHLVVDRNVLGVALPLSEKQKADGFAVMPRGSTMEVGKGLLRFFVYWKQTSQRTDYDLSALLLGKQFEMVDQLSWTRLHSYGGTHSGDLTDAANGATEFIDIDLPQVSASYIVPMINIYAGEDFIEVESCFFGLMQRTYEQKGKPFEARTVRFKSDIRGKGRVALPLVFCREKGQWVAKWMHLYLKGHPNFNRVEANHLTTNMLAQSIVSRDYLRMGYLVNMLLGKAEMVSWYEQGMSLEGSVSFIGLEAPEGLSEDSTTYTLSNLSTLLPA